MKKLLTGFLLSMVASASMAQSTEIKFDVVFESVLLGSGAFFQSLVSPETVGPELTGTVTLTLVDGTTMLDAAGTNTILLNGTFTTIAGTVPPSNQQILIYQNALFDLYTAGMPGSKVALDTAAADPKPIWTGTAIDGILSDQGAASAANCDFPVVDGNCTSANPALILEEGSTVNDAAGNAIYPELYDGAANNGGRFYPLISGVATASAQGLDPNNPPDPVFNHNNGLDGFFFSGLVCLDDPAKTACEGNDIVAEEGGASPPFDSVVRIYMAGGSGTIYIPEGYAVAAPVPVPAAAWLLGSALGLAGFMRHRRKTA